MNAIRPIVRPMDGPDRDPRWRLKLLGTRLSLSAVRVSTAMIAAAADEPGAIGRWNDALERHEQLRAEYRAQIETLTGMPADLIERGLAL